MFRPDGISLRTRVTALVVLVVTAISVGKSAFDLYSGADERETAMAYHLQMVTAMQAEALASPLWDFNVEQVTAILAGLAREKSFVRGSVTGANGKLVAEYGAKPGANGADDRDAWPLVASSFHDEGKKHEIVGTLAVTYSRRALDEAWWHQAVRSIETTLAAALVTLAAVLLSLRVMTRPLHALTAAMGRLASGDTAAPIAATDRHDEIGEMARAVDVFRQNMIRTDRLKAGQAAAHAARSRRQDAMERDTEAFGTSVSTVMTRLSGSAEDMRRAAEAMTQASATVHLAATSTSDGAVKSSRDLATTAAAIDELTSGFAEISRQVETAAAVSRQAVRRAEASQATIRGLAEATARIGDVVNLINTIAAQTNLLALNATIEAARAGDAGRGFAVVAVEVKALAAQTARATAEIGGQIDAMRGVTEATIAAMTEIGGMIGHMNELSSGMASTVEAQSLTTREIATRIKAVSGATAESSEAMGEVVQVAGKAGSASQEVFTGVAGIGKEADVLRAEVEQFLVMVRADSGERRRFERFAVQGVAAILTVPGRPALPAAVSDLSEGGAALRCDQTLDPGTAFAFELAEGGGAVAAQVVRIDENGVMGIVFDDPASVRAKINHAPAGDPWASLVSADTPGREDRDRVRAAGFRQAASS